MTAVWKHSYICISRRGNFRTVDAYKRRIFLYNCKGNFSEVLDLQQVRSHFPTVAMIVLAEDF